MFFQYLLAGCCRGLWFICCHNRANKDSDKPCLTGQLFNAVLVECAVITSGQLVFIAGDFHGDPLNTVCSAKCTANGMWMDLQPACAS